MTTPKPFNATLTVKQLKLLASLRAWAAPLSSTPSFYESDIWLEHAKGLRWIVRATYASTYASQHVLLRVDLPADEASGGPAYYDAKNIGDALKAVGANGKGVIRIHDDSLTLGGVTAKLIGNVPGAADVPLPTVSSSQLVGVVSATVLVEALRHCMRAMAKDGTRPLLESVHIRGRSDRQEIALESTDGFRAYLPVLPALMVSDFAFTLAGGAVKTALHAFKDQTGDIDIRLKADDEERRIQLSNGWVLMEATNVTGNYPNMEQIDPRRTGGSTWEYKMPNQITARADDLLSACKLARASKAESMQLESSEGRIRASWKRSEGDVMEIELLVASRADGAPAETCDLVVFDPLFLSDAIEAAQSDVVTLYCPIKRQSACILGDTVLMPKILPDVIKSEQTK